MPRFFTDSPLSPGLTVTLSGEDSRHVSRSLRMKPGDPLTLCDGKGADADCVIISVGEETAVEVKAVRPSESEPPYRAVVFQAATKGEKFDTVVQKATELGASSVTPFVSSRCIYRPDTGARDKKAQRWEKIAEEASKQSGRGVIPKIGETLAFSAMLAEAAASDIALFCWEGATEPLPSVLKGRTPSSVSVVVGPEGGFSEKEAEEARAAGLVPVSLGRRILRTETAAGAVLSILFYEYDL